MGSTGPTVFQYCKEVVLDGEQDDLIRCIIARQLELNHNIMYDNGGGGQGNNNDYFGYYSNTSSGMLSSSNRYNGFLMAISGALVFFMQPGFAMVCAGCVRKKNAQNTMLKNLLDACGSAIAFYCFGYGIAYGGDEIMTSHNPMLETTTTTTTTTMIDSSIPVEEDRGSLFTFVGNANFFGSGYIDAGYWFFQYAFAATAVTIVAGTLAERCRMTAYIFYSMFLSGFVYPVVAHAVWSTHGYLSAVAADPLLGVGMVDFAGGGVIHLTGGLTALFATLILGSRRGRFYDINTGRPLEKPKKIEGHSMPLQLLGTMFLWFGWYGFNAGSALFLEQEQYRSEVAALAAVNSSLAAAGGGLSALFTNLLRERKQNDDRNFLSFDLVKTMNGCLSGLVAVTVGCGFIENWAALFIGIVAGWVYVSASILLVQYRIDDAVDAIPVHMCNGIVGVLAAGLLASPKLLVKVYGGNLGTQHAGWFYDPSDFRLLACQLIGLVFISLWTCAAMLPFFVWLNHMGWFRADSVTEIVGLDMFYHGQALDDTGTGGGHRHHSQSFATARISSEETPPGDIPTGEVELEEQEQEEIVEDERQPPKQQLQQ